MKPRKASTGSNLKLLNGRKEGSNLFRSFTINAFPDNKQNNIWTVSVLCKTILIIHILIVDWLMILSRGFDNVFDGVKRPLPVDWRKQSECN